MQGYVFLREDLTSGLETSTMVDLRSSVATCGCAWLPENKPWGIKFFWSLYVSAWILISLQHTYKFKTNKHILTTPLLIDKIVTVHENGVKNRPVWAFFNVNENISRFLGLYYQSNDKKNNRAGGRHLCAFSNKTAYVKYNEFQRNRATFSYVVSLEVTFFGSNPIQPTTYPPETPSRS